MFGAARLNTLAKFTAAASGRNTITANGNAQVSTAQSQFGGASALFDGSGDFLSIPNNSSFNFGSSNFTVEFWMRATNFTGLPSLIGFGTIGSADGWNIQCSSGGVVFFEHGTGTSGTVTTRANTNTAVSTNTWTHVAFVRNGNTLFCYKGGVAGTSSAITYSMPSSTAQMIIGDGFGINAGNWQAQTDYNGYLDEIRISNTARYTAAFTPSASAFTNDANTLLLIHANGTNGSTVFTDDNA